MKSDNVEFEGIKYYMAAEKLENLLHSIDATFNFMEEFGIIPDEDVKSAIKPVIKRLTEWIK